jgi:hypothetical protein
MKKLLKEKIRALIGVAVAISATCVHAGSWDPYVHSVVIAPAPLLPLEFSGTGVCSLKPGNNGGDELPLGSLLNPNDLMVVTLSLANGVPNVADPSNATQALTALGGPGKDYWDWTYTPATKTYRGVQKRPIPAYTAEEVTVQYRVSANTFQSASPIAFNGLNVNISPPGYTNPQTTDNDQASSFTYVEAVDFGDAPASYGSASHIVDITKDASASPGPYYNRFFWLGSHIDSETNSIASSNAAGDDNSATNGVYGVNQDDEDGVTFPVMIPGTTVNIPVLWTFAAGSKPTLSQRQYGYLSAWIDWNGDGVFDDSDGSPEVISHTYTWNSDDEEWVWSYKQRRRDTTVTPANLSVSVPENAVVGRSIFARFRVSTTVKLTPNQDASDGEVEDYEITIQAPAQPATLGDRVWNDLDGDGVQESFEPGISGVRVYVDSNASGTYNAGEPTATTAVDGTYHIADLVVGTYTARVDTATLPVGLAQTYDLNGALDNAAIVTLTSGQILTDVDFGYRSSTVYVIRGQVRDDCDLDGTFSDPDMPVGGVLVSLYSDPDGDGINTDGVVIGTVRTTPDGRYAFTNVLSGAYVVVESDPVCSVSTADIAAANDNMIPVVIVNADSNDNDFLDAVDPAGYLYDVTDGRIVPGGLVSVTGAGADVLMDGSSGQYMFISTNSAETTFTLAVTPPAGYIIDTRRPAQPGSFDPTGGANPTVLGSYESATNPGYLLNYSAASNTYTYAFTLAPGDPPVINNNFPLVRLAAIGNFVWEDLNGDGVQDVGEPGMTNITVRLLDAASNVVHTTVTDVDGAYSFTNLFPETYLIQVVPPSQYILTLQNTSATNELANSDMDATGLTEPFVLAAGVTDNSWDAGLTLPALIYGHVFLDLNTNLVRTVMVDYPIANMTVTLWRAGVQLASTQTAADGEGTYAFTNLTAGDYTVRFGGDSNLLEAVSLSTDPERNRASLDVEGYIAIAVTVAPGDGVLATTEPRNAGFIRPERPLSDCVSIRAYSSSDGVRVEFTTAGEVGYGMITLWVWLDGAWVELGTTLSMGFGSNTYSFNAPGLEAGKAYYFRVEDEIGYLYDLYDVMVEPFAMEMQLMDRAGVRLTWNSIPGRSYKVYTTTRLGDVWIFVETVWADSDYASLEVTSDPQDRQRFFKIVMVRDDVIE